MFAKQYDTLFKRLLTVNETDSTDDDIFDQTSNFKSTEFVKASSNDDDNVPDTQPLPILNGVVAFVDVRTKNDNRSRGISGVLEQLGAKVADKFTNDVTHVIFKEGKKMTINKATKKGIHLVSVLWIDQCMKNEQKVPEKLYPAIVPESASGTPVITGRLKKLKSMQPNDFEEDVARSAEMCRVRRKRFETMNRFRLCEKTPSYSPLPVLVQDTQPRSPHTATADWQTPVFLTVPDTPQTIRQKLMEMQQAKQNGTPFSPFSRKDGSPPIKKLFGDGYEEDPFEEPKIAVQSVIEALEKETVDKPEGNLNTLTDTSHLHGRNQSSLSVSSESIDVCGNVQTEVVNTKNNSVQSSSSSPQPRAKRKKKLINISAPVMLNSFLVEPTHSSDKDRCDLLPSNQNQNSKCNNDTCHGNAKGKKQQASTKTRKRKVNIEGSSPEFQSAKNKKRRMVSSSSVDDARKSEMHSHQSALHRRRSARLSGINMNAQKNTLRNRKESSLSDQTDSSVFNSSTATTIGDASMSLYYGDATFSSMTGLPPPRQSIDEFSFGKSKKGRKCKPTILMPSVSENDTSEKENNEKSVSNFVKIKSFQKEKEHMESSSSSDLCGSKCVSNDDPCRTNCVQLRRAHSFVMEKSPNGPRIRPSLVMTRLHSEEQELVVSIVKKLTGFIIQDAVTDTTTHVVLGDGRRTLNVVNGIARGCWVINKEWVLKSSEAKQWLEEEQFEAVDKFPSCKITRLERQKAGVNYKQDLFSDVGPICISYKCLPPRGSLSALVRLCGGQVTGSVARARIYIGEESRPNVISLKPVWILDCISEHKLLPYDKYFNNTARFLRECSPEF